MSLLTVNRLYKRFNLEAGFFARYGRFVNALNGVSFTINENEAYGLVGESGCGKTTTARLLVRMYEADGGEIVYSPADGGGEGPLNVGGLHRGALRDYREKVRYVFQDPARSLNPRMSVYEVLVSGLRRSRNWQRAGEKQLREAAAAVLEEAGLQAADLERRPSEFSGGQRQRISIARGLLIRPRLLICDEVVSALDVSIQGQILNLLLDIRERHRMSFLFIAHDLKVACYFCDRIAVMYRGELMEEAPAAELYREGVHPYTKLLFSSATGGGKSPPWGALRSAPPPSTGGTAPRNAPQNSVEFCPSSDFADPAALSGRGKTPQGLAEDKPSAPPTSAANIPHCSFAERCPQVQERCFAEKPLMREIGAGHTIRCFL